MRLNRWLILWLCWLLPFQAVAANFSHCAKMTALFSTDASTHLMQSHEHCMHLMDADSVAKTKSTDFDNQQVSIQKNDRQNNGQKDCTACKIHCANVMFIKQSAVEQIHFVIQYVSDPVLTPKISLLISLPYKPPQVLA